MPGGSGPPRGGHSGGPPPQGNTPNTGGPGDASKQAPRQNPFAPGLGYDPAKPTPAKPKVITNTRVELPPSAWKLEGGEFEFPSELPLRPGTNTATDSKTVQIRLNQFKVNQWPQSDVYQYDVLIGHGDEKRGKVMAVWKSKTVQAELARMGNGCSWLWDGNKIAWTSKPVSQSQFTVNLDAEKGRRPRKDGTTDNVTVVISPSKQIRMACLLGYLDKKVPFTNDILEAINFLDHCMRQWPSEHYTSIKRSFFSRGQASVQLDTCITALKGVYTSIRLCDPKSSIGAPGTGLALNVDVANGTFWTCQDLAQAARNFCGGVRNRGNSYMVFRDQLLPSYVGGSYRPSEIFMFLRRMAKLRFHVKHLSKQDNMKEYVIKSFTFEKSKDGSNAKNTFFTLNRDGKEKRICVYDYYVQQYKIHLQHWYLPLIETTRAGMFPMELCTLVPNQRYVYKLSPDQTAAMIKFAVTRPKDRIASIQHGVGMLKWENDPYLKEYGVKIDPNMSVTSARLLKAPEVLYDKSKAAPGVSGRWDLRGKKFLFPNPEPLKAWGVVVVDSCLQESEVRNFMNVFVQTYIGHGGRVENKNPIIIMGARGEDHAQLANRARGDIGKQGKGDAQIMMFVLPGRDSYMYERLKKNMECRFATVSQMMNVAHVRKAQPQYCSNVCMKFNAKLGGTSCKASVAKPWFSRPTMILGADVSHPAPGSPQASMAALTMSFDIHAARYAAAVQTNGVRVEMITAQNFETMMLPLFRQWITAVGKGQGPQHIYYFRDGVSEGQYIQVLNQEVASMKAMLTKHFGVNGSSIRFTVVVCTKRHHIRFFPKENDNAAGDKNGNPLPGTLVERDVTHPFEYDFYLSSHSAIQGTARPVHYHVILDEAKVPVNDLQKMIYQHCYQYMRSTTPVSLYPAVYYAHLASNRARAHEDVASSAGPRGGQKFEEQRYDNYLKAKGTGAAGDMPPPTGGDSSTGSSMPTEAKPLVPLGNFDAHGAAVVQKLRASMWYI